MLRKLENTSDEKLADTSGENPITMTEVVLTNERRQQLEKIWLE